MSSFYSHQGTEMNTLRKMGTEQNSSLFLWEIFLCLFNFYGHPSQSQKGDLQFKKYITIKKLKTIKTVKIVKEIKNVYAGQKALVIKINEQGEKMN